MIITKVSVQGFQDILAVYGNSGVIIQKELDIAMRKSTLKLKGTAKIEAPVGVTNILRSAIYSKVYGGGAGLTGEVGVGPAAPHAAAVHDGSEPHMPPVAALVPWVTKKLGESSSTTVKPWQWPTKPKKQDPIMARAWALAIHIKKFGTKANPFMDRAWDKEQANINAFFEAAQANIAKQIGGS